MNSLSQLFIEQLLNANYWPINIECHNKLDWHFAYFSEFNSKKEIEEKFNS